MGVSTGVRSYFVRMKIVRGGLFWGRVGGLECRVVVCAGVVAGWETAERRVAKR